MRALPWFNKNKDARSFQRVRSPLLSRLLQGVFRHDQKGRGRLALPRLWPRERTDDGDVPLQAIPCADGDVLMDTCRKCGSEMVEEKCVGCRMDEAFCQCGGAT